MQYPVDPCRLAIGSNACRVLTIATVLRATNGANTCSFTGATTRTVAVADSYSVDAVVVPPNPVVPGNPLTPQDPCAPLGSFAIRYTLAISPANTITSVTAQTEPVT